MLSKFDCWQYRNDHNCWDYVREYLIEVFGIPEEHVPKYGIAPSDKYGMDKAANDVAVNFVRHKAISGAVACHYRRGIIEHVGIVDDGYVRHTGGHLRPNTQKTPIPLFERLAPKTIYMVHKWLL